MLIHIGADTLVREDDIIGYFDIDGKVDSEITNEFLKNAQKNHRCQTAGTDIPRSFVLAIPRRKGARSASLSDTKRGLVLHNGAGEKVIFTHISTQALKKR